MNKLDIKIFYLSCHNILKRRYGTNKPLHRKELTSQLGRLFLIPKNMRDIALIELEDLKMIKKISKDEYIVLDFDIDIERDSNKISQLFNLF